MKQTELLKKIRQVHPHLDPKKFIIKSILGTPENVTAAKVKYEEDRYACDHSLVILCPPFSPAPMYGARTWLSDFKAGVVFNYLIATTQQKA